jgi:hypothetical protein
MRRAAVIVALLVPSLGGGEERLAPALNRFVAEYNAFAKDWNGGLFNLRRAERLSRLWGEVERSGYWPRKGK